jgi:nitroreductase
MPITPDQLKQAMAWRYATKLFDPSRRIDAETWSALENALVQSPSSYGLQPWKFLVIGDPALRQQLRPESWNQSQITDASHLVVFLAERQIGAEQADRLLSAMASSRGLDAGALATYRRMIEVDLIEGPRSQQIGRWTSNQVYIALGTFMTAAALLEVDTCAIEGFDPAAYDRILQLEDSPYRSSVVCAAGYRDPADKYASAAKVRYPASELIELR